MSSAFSYLEKFWPVLSRLGGGYTQSVRDTWHEFAGPDVPEDPYLTGQYRALLSALTMIEYLFERAETCAHEAKQIISIHSQRALIVQLREKVLGQLQTWGFEDLCIQAACIELVHRVFLVLSESRRKSDPAFCFRDRYVELETENVHNTFKQIWNDARIDRPSLQQMLIL